MQRKLVATTKLGKYRLGETLMKLEWVDTEERIRMHIESGGTLSARALLDLRRRAENNSVCEFTKIDKSAAARLLVIHTRYEDPQQILSLFAAHATDGDVLHFESALAARLGSKILQLGWNVFLEQGGWVGFDWMENLSQGSSVVKDFAYFRIVQDDKGHFWLIIKTDFGGIRHGWERPIQPQWYVYEMYSMIARDRLSEIGVTGLITSEMVLFSRRLARVTHHGIAKIANAPRGGASQLQEGLALMVNERPSFIYSFHRG